MSPKHFIIIGMALLGVLLIAVWMNKPIVREESETHVDPAHMASPKQPTQSKQETPSKQNVNSTVRQTLEHLHQLVKENPNDSKMVFELARVLQDAHNIAEAIQYYKRGLELDVTNTVARIDYSLCLFEVGRTNDALEQTKLVLKRDPKNAQACYNAGAIYANIGMGDSAKVYWSRLVAAHPEDSLATKAKENIKKLSAITAAR